MNLAYNFSDRIALLKDGEIKYIGKPSEVITEKKLQEIYNTPISIDKNDWYPKIKKAVTFFANTVQNSWRAVLPLRPHQRRGGLGL